jgi:hypothetical protein
MASCAAAISLVAGLCYAMGKRAKGNHLRKRDFIIAGAVGLAALSPAVDAQAQKFTAMNRAVEGFLTGLWVRTSAPAERPPNEAEVAQGLARCDESMIDRRSEAEGLRSVFPSEGATHGDISMFRSDGVFILAERMQTPAGLSRPSLRRMSVGAVQQNRITVRFVSQGQWANGGWIEQPGPPALWGDAMLGDLDIGGNTEHVIVLGKDNTQVTYVKCGS